MAIIFTMLFLLQLASRLLATQNMGWGSFFSFDTVRGLRWAMIPAIKFFNPASGGKKRNPDGEKKNGEDIILDLAGEDATVEEEQKEMIRGIFGLEETSVREIMVPRVDIAAIDDDATLSDAIDIIVKQGHSRIPLYRDTTDNIIGIIHAKDLLPFWIRG